MTQKSYLAIDMGASSGRHVVGHFDGAKLTLEEVYRFDNGGTELGGRVYWDLPAQWHHVRQGLLAAGAHVSGPITSVGVDTWGVDFALLDHNDELLANPVHYRDGRTDGALARAFAEVSREEIFQQTGIQFLQFNTLYQLLAMRDAGSPLLEVAKSLLMMPDVFHWLMTGEKSNEFTDVTTTQCFNPLSGTWATDLLEEFKLPTHLLGTIQPPGTSLGKLTGGLAQISSLRDTQVVLPGTHDTASAVLAVPTRSSEQNWCYISLGTWALMGVETAQPVINDTSLALNFTNEGGAGNTYRLLKNICGLWMIQECRRVWKEAGHDWNWDELTAMAEKAPSLVTLINPDAHDFLAPENMPEAIRQFAARSGQHVPADEGTILRVALESLAMKFRHVLEMCETLTGARIDTIHILGGGTRNRFLCQAAADACGRSIVTGPVEATAAGNIMMQAVAAGDVGSIAEARGIIRDSFEMQEYEPKETAAWEDAYGQFLAILDS